MLSTKSRWPAALWLAAMVIGFEGCGGQSSPGHAAAAGGAAAAPAAPASTSVSAAGAPASDASGAIRVDMEAIFPPGPGRDVVLNACQNCHTFVPIVVLQMNEEAWTRNSRDHRMRVSAMSDADFAAAYDYLKKNFNPSRPVPKLPPELLSSWTTS